MVITLKTAGVKLIGKVIMFCACLLRIFNKGQLCRKNVYLSLAFIIYNLVEEWMNPTTWGFLAVTVIYQEVLTAKQDQTGPGQFLSV